MTTDIVFVIQDGKGSKSTVTVPLPAATALADAVAFAQTIWPLIDPLITGGNVVARVSQVVSGITSNNPLGGSDIQEKAKFIFQSLSPFTKALSLPTFLETKMVPGSDVVDASDADVAAFITGMVSGLDTTGNGGSGVIQPCDIRDEDLSAFLTAVEAWGK